MAPNSIDEDGDAHIVDGALAHLVANRHLFESFAQSMVAYFENDPQLTDFIHFIKYRVKDERSLRGKLERLLRSAPAAAVDPESLANSVTDYAGVRIVHLHMDQLSAAHPKILAMLADKKCEFLEQPTAHIWDVEYEELFRKIGIRTEQRPSMYMTVHYNIIANQRTRITCEIQVRSLVEELWGEVSHRVNYPVPSRSIACQDQLRVLARLSSGCGRLVDSIIKSHGDAD